MLQYAAPSAPRPRPHPQHTFQRPPCLFADPPSSHAKSHTSPPQPAPPEHPRPLDSQDRHHRDPFASAGRLESHDELQLPALSALASIAANAPAMNAPPPRSNSGDSTRSSTPSTSTPTNMASAPFAPAATAGGTTQNSPPVCGNCQTSTTPLWRRDESGSVLCNACGLFLKLHGRSRPISLKTDVIKSRNRVKTVQPKKRDSHGGQDGLIHTNGHSASYPDGPHAGVHTHSLPMGFGEQQPRMPSPGSASRSNTPALSQQHQNPNIAPQHLFDTVSLPSDTFASPSLPSFALRNPSPAPSTLNGSQHQTEQAQSYEALVTQNNTLRTRVSELEVINDLFRGRVAELESSEQAARRNEGVKDEQVRQLHADFAAATARAADLERILSEMKAEAEADGPARKKSRTDSGTNGQEGSSTAEKGTCSVEQHA